jgi:hypothetical protein
LRLYLWAFAADPALADDLKNGHSFNAACVAAGNDEEMTTFGVEEWGCHTGLALKWLQANLAQMASQSQDSKRWQEVLERLTHWKKDSDLASVRDPAWLAVMPPADRRAWEALWGDVDAVLTSVTPRAGPPPAKQ